MDPKEKRKRVMGRSIKLGHCVCDPRKPCPCPLFKEKNVCTCAGERVPPEGGDEVRLTDHVRHAGCASKIGQSDLHAVLSRLPVIDDPRLLVGTATADDAGVFRLTDDVTVVQTVDVFTPGVDDPYTFGKIAACNSLSDVYAMGGRPVTALSVMGFPIEKLPREAMARIIEGGMEVLAEAGTILLGGHSINDEEIKFGFAVTGVVEAGSMVTNSGARPGDALVLTKPLGTGIVSLAGQIGRASEESLAALAAAMTTLNRQASEIMVKHGASACTDVTGFGLLGHLAQMVKESGVTAEIWCDQLPLLPGVPEYAAEGMYSGANERNSEYSGPITEFADDVAEGVRAVLFDAQTSGGLLIAVASDSAEGMLADLHSQGVTAAVAVGVIADRSDGGIVVRSTRPAGRGRAVPPARVVEDRTLANEEEKQMAASAEQEEVCCAHGSGSPGEALGMFREFMGTALQPGAVDVVTKELIAVALGLAVNCVPCSKIHIKKARDMGIGADELEEAAALAVAFGGCRALMLWKELSKGLREQAK